MCLAPGVRVDRREECVRRDARVNPRELDHPGQGQRLGEDVGTADHGDFPDPTGSLQRLLEGVHDRRALDRERAIASNDDAVPPWQRPANRVPGAPSHDHRLAHGQRLEAPEIRGQVPG